MKKRDQPHDRYFRDLMEDINVASSFLRAYANPKVKEQINWSTLDLYDTSLVGGNNKQLYADVVYKAQTKAKEEMFLVLNHERKADRLLPIRRLEYKLGVLKKAIKQNKKPALIYFLTWYNGQKVPYPYAKSISEYFTLSELAQELLLQDEILVAKDIPDEIMYNHEESSILELLMKHSDNPDLLEWIVAHPAIAEKMTESRYIGRSLEYVADIGYHKLEKLLEALGNVSKELKEAMLTTTQQIEKRGIQQGMQQGMEQGMEQGMQQGMQQEKLEIAKTMLSQLHLNLDVVQKATGLSREELEQLKAEA